MSEITILIKKILDAIEYSGDKEKYALEFDKNTRNLCMLDLIGKLNPEQQEYFKDQFETISKDPKGISNYLSQHLTEETINNSIQNTIRSNIADYIQAVTPTLTEIQSSNLEKVLMQEAANNKHNKSSII